VRGGWGRWGGKPFQAGESFLDVQLNFGNRFVGFGKRGEGGEGESKKKNHPGKTNDCFSGKWKKVLDVRNYCKLAAEEKEGKRGNQVKERRRRKEGRRGIAERYPLFSRKKEAQRRARRDRKGGFKKRGRKLLS